MNEITEFLQSTQGIELLQQILHDKLNVSVSVEKDWYGDDQQFEIQVDIEFNDKVITSNSDTFTIKYYEQ